MPWPNRELASARPFRRSPAYHLLKQANAGFGSKMGWERANFFAPPGQAADIEYGWGQQNWQPWSWAEQRAARTGVAVFDQTSFSKYLVTGRDAEQALQWLCTADVAVAPGRTVYTGMLNAHGTYEADITVTRLREWVFLVGKRHDTERNKASRQGVPGKAAPDLGARFTVLRHGHDPVAGPAQPPVRSDSDKVRRRADASSPGASSGCPQLPQTNHHLHHSRSAPMQHVAELIRNLSEPAASSRARQAARLHLHPAGGRAVISSSWLTVPTSMNHSMLTKGVAGGVSLA